jgi:hypothetical protein
MNMTYNMQREKKRAKRQQKERKRRSLLVRKRYLRRLKLQKKLEMQKNLQKCEKKRIASIPQMTQKTPITKLNNEYRCFAYKPIFSPCKNLNPVCKIHGHYPFSAHTENI